MTDKVKITSFEIENVKRVQAVTLEPLETGLTIIGGDNYQGKSSCLDAIMSALGGEKFTPSDPIHEGADKGSVTIKLSNGLTVTRSFTKKGTYLKIDCPDGGKTGQALLNEFINSFALDLSSFLNASEKVKAEVLLNIIGVDLTPYNEKIAKMEGDRLAVGRQEVKAKGHAESMPYDEEAGSDLLTPTDMMTELEKKISANAKNREIRENVEAWLANLNRQRDKVKEKLERIDDLQKRIVSITKEYQEERDEVERMDKEYTNAIKQAEDLVDEDTTAIKDKLAEIDATNARIHLNLEREKAFNDVANFHEEYLNIQRQIVAIREEKLALLNGASMPLESLSVDNDTLTYKERAWDCMSHSDQMITATAICRAVNPKMGFVLLDKIEAMDMSTLQVFGEWLNQEDLQVISTKVSQGDECSFIIEDGMVKEAEEEIEF